MICFQLLSGCVDFPQAFDILANPVEDTHINEGPKKVFPQLLRADSLKSLPLPHISKDIFIKLRRFSSPKVVPVDFAPDIILLKHGPGSEDICF